MQSNVSVCRPSARNVTRSRQQVFYHTQTKVCTQDKSSRNKIAPHLLCNSPEKLVILHNFKITLIDVCLLDNLEVPSNARHFRALQLGLGNTILKICFKSSSVFFREFKIQ